MVPIVFYNGEDKWTAVTNFRDYQEDGKLFGSHVLNLEYYLVNLSAIEENVILSTNTVLDNIMYCDKLRKKQDLVDALRTAYQRVDELGNQEKEEFNNWAKNILLTVCDGKEEVVKAILDWTGKGEEDMAFKYNIIKMFEDERAEGEASGKAIGRAIGKAEDILELLEELEPVPKPMRNTIMEQKDLDILTIWLKAAAKAESLEEWKTKVKWKEE